MNSTNFQQLSPIQSTKRFLSQERPIQGIVQPRFQTLLIPISPQQKGSLPGYPHPPLVTQFFSQSIPEQPKLVKLPIKEEIHLMKPTFSKKYLKPQFSVKEQVEQLKQLFQIKTKFPDITLSSSSCLTLQAATEQEQCQKALELIQMLDYELNNKSIIKSADFGGKRSTIKSKFTAKGEEQNQNNLSQNKAYYTSKDISKLGSSYYGGSEGSFQQQNIIKSLNESNRLSKVKDETPLANEQIIQSGRQSNISQSSSKDLLLNSKFDASEQLLQKDSSLKQNTENPNGEQRTLTTQNDSITKISCICMKKQKNQENKPKSKTEVSQNETQQSPKKLIQTILQESQLINIQESERANQINQEDVMPEQEQLINSEKIDIKQSEKDSDKKRIFSKTEQQICMLQILEHIKQQSQSAIKNSGVQLQNQSNCSTVPQIIMDVMKGSFLSDQSYNQKKNITMFNLEPQQEYLSKQSKQLGFFNYQISIINPVERGFRKSYSAERKNFCIDLMNNNDDFFHNQQEMRLKRLEEQLLLSQPKTCDLLGIQSNINLLDLSKPLNEDEKFQNCTPSKNSSIHIPFRSLNLFQSKSSLLAPQIEDFSSYMQAEDQADKTLQMEEGFDLIAKKQQKQQNEQLKTQSEKKSIDNSHSDRKDQQNRFQGINNYTQHLHMVKAQYKEKCKSQLLKDNSSPSLSSIQQDYTSKSFIKQKRKNFISKNKKSIEKKERKLDPYFEFKRQLNKNLEDYHLGRESFSILNSFSRLQSQNEKKTITTSQFGEISEEKRGNLQLQIYQKTIEQVQQKLQELQKK